MKTLIGPPQSPSCPAWRELLGLWSDCFYHLDISNFCRDGGRFQEMEKLQSGVVVR